MIILKSLKIIIFKTLENENQTQFNFIKKEYIQFFGHLARLHECTKPILCL